MNISPYLNQISGMATAQLNAAVHHSQTIQQQHFIDLLTILQTKTPLVQLQSKFSHMEGMDMGTVMKFQKALQGYVEWYTRNNYAPPTPANMQTPQEAAQQKLNDAPKPKAKQ